MKLSSRLRLFRAKHRTAAHAIVDAWRYLIRGTARTVELPPDVLHPNPTPSLCTCYGEHNAGREAYDEHEPGCPWLEVVCRTCMGDGCCRSCGGDGTMPSARATTLLDEPELRMLQRCSRCGRRYLDVCEACEKGGDF